MCYFFYQLLCKYKEAILIDYSTIVLNFRYINSLCFPFLSKYTKIEEIEDKLIKFFYSRINFFYNGLNDEFKKWPDIFFGDL